MREIVYTRKWLGGETRSYTNGWKALARARPIEFTLALSSSSSSLLSSLALPTLFLNPFLQAYGSFKKKVAEIGSATCDYRLFMNSAIFFVTIEGRPDLLWPANPASFVQQKI